MVLQWNRSSTVCCKLRMLLSLGFAAALPVTFCAINRTAAIVLPSRTDYNSSVQSSGVPGVEIVLPTLAEILSQGDDLVILNAVISQFGGVQTMLGNRSSSTRFTMFAPNDAAMTTIARDFFGVEPDELFTVPEIVDILDFHIIRGKVLMADDLKDNASLQPILGKPSSRKKLAVGITESGAWMIEDAEVVRTDVEAANGVIHVIDKVLIPPIDELGIATEPIWKTEYGG